MSRRERDAMAEQAAQWLVQLSSDDEPLRRRARQAFEAWKRADPRHAEVAAGMEGLLGQAGTLRETGAAAPGAQAVSAVLARRTRRRVRAGAAALALACVLCLPAWLALRMYSPGYLLADVRSGVGEWTTQVLSDGTRITLNGASAVNLRYDAARRTIQLVQGDVLVEVAKDPARPLVVETPDGRMRALGTRFVASRQEASTLLSVLESKVEASAGGQPDGQGAVVVEAGRQVRITAHGVGPAAQVDAQAVENAWKRRRLLVDDQPLASVLDTLGRYRRGLIRYDASELAGVRISAVLPLDDTDRALQLLAANLPGLRVRAFTPYLLQVDLP